VTCFCFLFLIKINIEWQELTLVAPVLHLKHGTPSTTSDVHPHGPRRWLFNYVHRTNGLVILVLTLMNVAIGLKLSHGWIKDPAFTFYFVVVITGIFCSLVLEILHFRPHIENEVSNYYEPVVRHVYAIMASTALACAIVICTIIEDSDDV